jgi:tRNA(Arg) A34 adenosine deaminase TadA
MMGGGESRNVSGGDEEFLRQAIALARENVETGKGGPFGAVIVKDGEVIATGVNRVTATNDPSAHAEVVAIRAACKALGTFSLEGATLYASSAMCAMCSALVVWSRLERVVYGCNEADAARAGFDDLTTFLQVARPIDQRAIPATQMLRDEALVPLQLWQAADDKVEY